jgi:hypothetical protein
MKHSNNIKNLFLYNSDFLARFLENYGWKTHIILHLPTDCLSTLPEISVLRDKFLRDLLSSLKLHKNFYYFAVIEGGSAFQVKPHLHIITTFDVKDVDVQHIWISLINGSFSSPQLGSDSILVTDCKENKNIATYVTKSIGAIFLLNCSEGLRDIDIYVLSNPLKRTLFRQVTQMCTSLANCESKLEIKQVEDFIAKVTGPNIVDFPNRKSLGFLIQYVFKKQDKYVLWFNVVIKEWQDILNNKRKYKTELDPVIREVLTELTADIKSFNKDQFKPTKNFRLWANKILPYILSSRSAIQYKIYAGVSSFFFYSKFNSKKITFKSKKEQNIEIHECTKRYDLFKDRLNRDSNTAFNEIGRIYTNSFLQIFADAENFFDYDFSRIDPDPTDEEEEEDDELFLDQKQLDNDNQKNNKTYKINLMWPSSEKLKKTPLGKELAIFLKSTLKQQLPMIYEPKKWELSINENLKNNCSGGYLKNSNNFNVPLLTTSHSHEFGSTSTKLNESLNHLQERPFIVDNEMLQFLHNSMTRPSVETCLTTAEAHKEAKTAFDELKQKFRNIAKNPKLSEKSKNKEFAKLYQLKRDYLGTMSRNDAQTRVLEQLQLLHDKFHKIFPVDYFFIWFPYGVDTRGRVKSHAYANPMSEKLVRSLLLHPYPIPFNLELFKFYSYKCWKNEYVDIKTGAERFDFFALGHKMANFELDPSIYAHKDVKEPELMLACCFEWKRYLQSIKIKPEEIEFTGYENKLTKRYLSRFMMTRDATASGWQIISMLLKDGRYQSQLNLKPKEDEAGKVLLEKTPVSFYDSIFKEFAATDYGKIFFTEEYFKSKEFTKYLRTTYKDLFNLGYTELEITCQFFRPLFKSFLMKGVYGGTQYTFTKDFYEFFREKTEKGFPVSFVDKLSKKFRDNLWTWFTETPAGKYSEILYEIADFARSKKGLKFRWSTPLETFITQSYNTLAHIRVQRDPLFLVGRGLPIRNFTYGYFDRTKTDDDKMKTALPPNLIHSLDAAIIHSLSLIFQKEFPELSFQTTHDCVLFPLYFEEYITTQIRHAYFNIFFKHSTVDAENKRGLFKVLLDRLIEQLYAFSDSRDPVSRADIDDLKMRVEEKFRKFEKLEGYTTFIPDALLDSLTCIVH